MIQVLQFILLFNVIIVSGYQGVHLNNTENEHGCQDINGLCHFIPTFLPFILDNILCNQPSIYQNCPRTCKICSEVQFATRCPQGTFDIERTCSQLGEWCEDSDARDGCIGCAHCDLSDRESGKCPECPPGN